MTADEARDATTSRERVLAYLARQGGSVESPDGRGLTQRMADAVDYRSVAALNAMLVTLEREGLITREVRGRRTFRVSLVERPATRRRRRRPPRAGGPAGTDDRAGTAAAATAGDTTAGAATAGDTTAAAATAGDTTAGAATGGDTTAAAATAGDATAPPVVPDGAAPPATDPLSPAAGAGAPSHLGGVAPREVGRRRWPRRPGGGAKRGRAAGTGGRRGARAGDRGRGRRRSDRAVYEVRAVDDRWAQPMGGRVVSRHRSSKAALAAMQREQRRYRRGGGRWASGAYLPRIVVRVDPDGTETPVVPGGANR